MTAEQLRNSLLQEAISGRLVPQDPNDEPAAVLLARISEEKERLIKEKKLKKEKPATPITDDEIPFEIPATWEWVRFGEYMEVIGGYAFPSDSIKGNEGPRVIRISDISKQGFVDKSIVRYKGKPIPDAYKIVINDILIAMTGGTVGKSMLVSTLPEEMYLNQRVAIIRNLWFDIRYIDTVIKAPHIKEIINDRKNSTNDNISMVDIRNFLLPLPPLAEQQRIVAKLEELLPIIDEYGKAQIELDQLNATLPSRLRQSILQQAIQGKLVPQDEKESVNDLVHRLQDALNVSPFKKKWNSEEISEDELPFDIPENWHWMRLGDIVYTQTGLSYSKGDLEKKVPNPVRVLRGGNIQNGAWCIKGDDVMIAPEFVKKDIFLKKNSFITPAVTSLEHLGKTALIREDHNDIVAGGFVLYLMPYDVTNDELMEYLAYFFQSAFYNSFCKTITNKSGQAFWNISREKLLKLPIPLPPLAEQQRIVAKIEELFAEIDKLK